METTKDPELWRIAKKRAKFKSHLVTYIIINVFFWAIWFFTEGRQEDTFHQLPWPAWSMLGWGIGLAFNYYNAYQNGSSVSATQREYDKLKNEGK